MNSSDQAADSIPLGVRRSTRYFPELESLRGIAITLVVLYHADGVVRDMEGKSGTIGTALSAFVHAGHTGVNLFFILSGFLLSLPFLIESAGGKRVVRRDYYVRRALRILPLYYAAVVVATILSASRPADLLLGLPPLAFLHQTAAFYTPRLMPYSGVWWTLATEIQFYLLLPLLPLCLRSRLGRRIGAGLLVGYGIAYAGFLQGTVRMQTILGEICLGLSLFGHAPLFLFGIAAAWLYLHRGDAIRGRLSRAAALRNGGADLALLVTVAVLGYLLRWAASVGFWGVEGYRLHAWHLGDGALWTMILLLLLLAPLRLKWLFSNRVWTLLGVLSYSIYMVHYPIYRLALDALRRAHPSLPTGWSLPIVAVVTGLSGGCLLVSALTYRLIEHPFLARKARIDR